MKAIRRAVVEDDDGDQDADGIGIDPDDFQAFSGDVYPEVPGIDLIDDMRADDVVSNARIV